MGLLSTLNNLVTKNPIVSSLVTPVANLVQKIAPNPVSKFVSEKPVTTALIVAGGAAGTLTKVGAAAATSIARSLIPTTAKQAVVTGTTAIVGYGVLSETKKPLEAVAKAPSALVNFGKDVGKFVEDPTLLNAEKILKENKGVSVALATGGLILGGTALAKTLLPAAGAVSNIQTKEAVQDLTNTLQNVPNQISLVDTSKPIASNSNVPSTPVTPQTQTMPSTSNNRKKYSRKVKALPQNITQRVNVVVQNKNSSVGIKQSKNYLKRSVYA